MTARRLALRFLWGQHQGGLMPLQRGRSLLIGRQADADLVLADELVSRQHARLTFQGDELVVEDVGSTNGTYLNGRRVTRERLAEGDRLLLGASIIKVVASERGPAPEPLVRDAKGGAPEAAPAGEERRARAMQGRLEDVPLQDLLQLFATARKTGVLVVERPGHRAEVQFENGCLTRCEIDGRTDLPARKSLCRLLAWTQGQFELRRAPPQAGAGPPESLEPVLMEGLRQLDELRHLRAKLPGRFTISDSVAGDVDEVDRALLALVARRGSLQAVLDATPLGDLEAAQRIAALLARGVLVGLDGVTP